MHTITVTDELALKHGGRFVAQLRTDEALDLAARLARGAFRRIAFEEGAASLFDGAESNATVGSVKDA